jgi:hypothetical protein
MFRSFLFCVRAFYSGRAFIAHGELLQCSLQPLSRVVKENVKKLNEARPTDRFYFISTQLAVIAHDTLLSLRLERLFREGKRKEGEQHSPDTTESHECETPHR